MNQAENQNPNKPKHLVDLRRPQFQEKKQTTFLSQERPKNVTRKPYPRNQILALSLLVLSLILGWTFLA